MYLFQDRSFNIHSYAIILLNNCHYSEFKYLGVIFIPLFIDI